MTVEDRDSATAREQPGPNTGTRFLAKLERPQPLDEIDVAAWQSSYAVGSLPKLRAFHSEFPEAKRT